MDKQMDKRLLAWAVLLFLLFVWTFTRIKHFIRTMFMALSLPGPRAWPIVGNIFTLNNDKELFKISNYASQLYGPLFRFWLFFFPVICVYEPDHLKVILNNSKVSEKNFFYKILNNIIGEGLITSNGEKWRKNRKLIQPYFHINILEKYFKIFLNSANEMMESLRNEKCIKITHLVNNCVLENLHTAVLGISLQPGEKTPFRGGEIYLTKRLTRPWLLFDPVFHHSEMSKNESKKSSKMHYYVEKVLEKRIAERKSGKTDKNCLLDIFIELSETSNFSHEDILNETVTFMLAGQDSVGSALAFCMFYLARHQDVQQKVFNEIDDLILENQPTTIQLEQLNKMYYLEQCIKETLRLAPSVPLISRVLTTDVTLGKHHIPCGTNLVILPFSTHRLPHIFPDPLKFDPDRFSPENSKKIHPYGFIPFSSGPRNCIGYKFAYFEIKTIIATLIKNYHISLKDESEHLKVSFKVSLRAKNGVTLNIRPRNEAPVLRD